MAEQLSLFPTEESTSFAAAPRAKTSPPPVSAEAWRRIPRPDPPSLSSIFDWWMNYAPDASCGRMSPESCPRAVDLTSETSCVDWSNSGLAWRGGCLTASTPEATHSPARYRNAAAASSCSVCGLTDILEPMQSVPQRYYLSEMACLGIRRRSAKRGKPLPPPLDMALSAQIETSRRASASPAPDTGWGGSPRPCAPVTGLPSPRKSPSTPTRSLEDTTPTGGRVAP
jgi:hypothetical protein